MSKLDEFLEECEKPVPSMNMYADINEGCAAQIDWEDKQLTAVLILVKMMREIQNTIGNQGLIDHTMFTRVAERVLEEEK